MVHESLINKVTLSKERLHRIHYHRVSLKSGMF